MIKNFDSHLNILFNKWKYIHIIAGFYLSIFFYTSASFLIYIKFINFSLFRFGKTYGIDSFILARAYERHIFVTALVHHIRANCKWEQRRSMIIIRSIVKRHEKLVILKKLEMSACFLSFDNIKMWTKVVPQAFVERSQLIAVTSPKLAQGTIIAR